MGLPFSKIIQNGQEYDVSIAGKTLVASSSADSTKSTIEKIGELSSAYANLSNEQKQNCVLVCKWPYDRDDYSYFTSGCLYGPGAVDTDATKFTSCGVSSDTATIEYIVLYGFASGCYGYKANLRANGTSITDLSTEKTVQRFLLYA